MQLELILDDYMEQVGKKLTHEGNSDYALRKWLENIAHVRTEVHNSQIVYFSEAPDQKHLAELIRHQRNSSRAFRKPKKGLHTLIGSDMNEPPFVTPRAWTSSLVFRRRKLANSSFGGQRIDDMTFKQPFTPNRTFLQPAKPHAPKRSLPMDTSSIVGSTRKKFNYRDDDDFDVSLNNLSRNTNCSNASRISNVSSVTDRFIEESHVRF